MRFKRSLTKPLALVALALSACTMLAKKDVAENPVPPQKRNPAGVTETRAGLEGWLNQNDNAKLWSEYCIGDPNGADVPRFRYDTQSSIGKKAVENLAMVEPRSFFLYREIEEVYGLREKGSTKDKKKPLAQPDYPLPKGVSVATNAFLVYLCGEFRDRATMISEKLNWLAHLYKLPARSQSSMGNYDVRNSPWSHMSAEGYDRFISISSQLWSARKQVTPSVNLGFTVDGAVEGMSVCQVKFIIKFYVNENSAFDSLPAFENAYKNFRNSPGACSPDEISDYYTFRGDTNFKPNSPESNAMIFRGRFMAASCSSPTKAKKSDGTVTDADCKDYFTHPFQRRWEAARAGLAAWLFHEQVLEKDFGQTSAVQITMHLSKDGSRPLNFSVDLAENPTPNPKLEESLFMPNWLSLYKKGSAWQDPDMGFNKIMNLGGPKPNPDFERAYMRIKNAVDRHTDWYRMGFFDTLTGRKGEAAYSPFVASSYEMNASNGFVGCGTTVPCTEDSDDRKQWMFVFRVKKDNWYRTQDLQAAKPADISRVWFDETSFGTTGLAKSEHAWDRLGTAMEGEYDSIIYLHNITRDGEIKLDGLPQGPSQGKGSVAGGKPSTPVPGPMEDGAPEEDEAKTYCGWVQVAKSKNVEVIDKKFDINILVSGYPSNLTEGNFQDVYGAKCACVKATIGKVANVKGTVFNYAVRVFSVKKQPVSVCSDVKL